MKINETTLKYRPRNADFGQKHRIKLEKMRKSFSKSDK
jgi:hypothetical protein